MLTFNNQILNKTTMNLLSRSISKLVDQNPVLSDFRAIIEVDKDNIYAIKLSGSIDNKSFQSNARSKNIRTAYLVARDKFLINIPFSNSLIIKSLNLEAI